jgi:fluoroquinolone transport system permease protein
MNWKTITYDAKLLRGDPMLILSMMVPFILWALMQFGFPLAAEFIRDTWSYDINLWYRHAGYFFVILIPMMFGMVYGFILLDERDGGIITAISVTPIGKAGYLKLRLGIPILVSFIAVIMFQVLLQLQGSLQLHETILLSALLASESLMLLLFLAAFADNKIVGLAISKGFGILLVGPLLDFILPQQLKWLGAYSPMFWTGRAFMAEASDSFWLYLLGALVFHGFLILLLFKKFIKRSD